MNNQCPHCNGTGETKEESFMNLGLNIAIFHAPLGINFLPPKACEYCHGTGRLDDASENN